MKLFFCMFASYLLGNHWTAYAGEQVNLTLDAQQMVCEKGQLTWYQGSMKFPTKYYHYVIKSSFPSQYECYRFIVNVISNYGQSAVANVDVQAKENEVIRSESYKTNCRWINGGLGGPRQVCSTAYRDQKWLDSLEVISIELDGIIFKSQVSESKRI